MLQEGEKFRRSSRRRPPAEKAPLAPVPRGANKAIVHINERKGVRLFSQLTKLREKKDSTSLGALSRARPS
jgi:hypothetical protein